MAVGDFMNRLRASHLRRAARWLRNSRAGVAVAYAIMAPVLIAGTGVAVDTGYWYQQQTQLQAAADAAAMAVAQGSVASTIVTSDANDTFVNGSNGSTGAAVTFAVNAANAATDSKYNFQTTGTASVSVSGSYTASGTTGGKANYTVTVTAPRNDFFSKLSVPLLGLHGLGNGTQSTSATVLVSETYTTGSGTTGSSSSTDGTNSPGYCSSNCQGIYTNKTISASGGSNVTCTNCGIYGGGTLSVSGSGVIMGDSVSTGTSTLVSPQYSGYIGTTTTTSSPVGGSSGHNVTFNATPPTDYLASMNASNTLLWNPGWTTASAPAESGSAVAPNLGYNTWNVSGEGDCVNSSGFYNYVGLSDYRWSAYCELAPGYYKGMSSVGVNALLLNQGTTNGTTYITGGLSGQSNSITTLNGNNYYIDTKMSWSSSTSFTINGGSSTVNCGSSGTTALTSQLCFTVAGGGMSITNGTATFGAGTYFLNGPTKTKSNVTSLTGYGLVTNAPTVTIKGGQWFVAGGVDLSGGTTSSALASGLYEFSSYSGASNGAFYAEQGYDAFGDYITMPSSGVAGTCPADSSTTTAAIAPATYYFDGGLTISSGTKGVLLCSGIYYIRNGNLVITSGSTVTGTNVTFILQGNASFTFNGGATINLSAPTTTTDPSCVAPSAYPQAAYETPTMPYDGTNGHGICGVIIYQDRNDTATDTINEGASSTFNGAIYTPSAPVVLSGAGALNITATGTSGLTADSITDSGSGKVSVTVNAVTGGGGAGSSSSGSSTSTGGTSSGGGTTIKYASYLLVG